MEIRGLLIIVIALLTVIAVVLVYGEFDRKQKANEALRENVAMLTERMVKLEQAKNKRMPYEAFESILDARAALSKEKEEFQFFVSLIENAEAHLDKAVTVGTKKGKDNDRTK